MLQSLRPLGWAFRLLGAREAAVAITPAITPVSPGPPPAVPSSKLAFGEAFALSDGLRLTVAHACVDGAIPVPSGETALRMLMRVRVENPTEQPAVFDNQFGVVDRSGRAYPRSYASAGDASLLPGIARLSPGQALEGEVRVPLTVAALTSSDSWYPAYLAAVRPGCSTCDHSLPLVPLATWEPVSLGEAARSDAETTAPPMTHHGFGVLAPP